MNVDRTEMERYPSRDDVFEPPTDHPEFERVLAVTATFVVAICATKLSLSNIGIDGTDVFKRAMNGLPQMPHEAGGAGLRWCNARWLSLRYLLKQAEGRLESGQKGAYCVTGEHPYTKTRTIALLDEILTPMLRKGIEQSACTAIAAAVLRARLDTALVLGGEEKKKSGVGWPRISRVGDGLARYAQGPVLLYDRMERIVLRAGDIARLDNAVDQQVNDARTRSRDLMPAHLR